MGRAKRLMEEMESRMARGYVVPESGKKYVCEHHFKNEYISRHIVRNSRKGRCSYCGRSGQVMDLADLVEYLGGRLTAHLGDIEQESLYCASSFCDEDGELNMPGHEEYMGLVKPAKEQVYETFEEVGFAFGCLPDDEDLFEDINACFYVSNWIRKDPVGLQPFEALRFAWQDFAREIVNTVRILGIDHTQPYDSFKLLNDCEVEMGEFGMWAADSVVDECSRMAANLVRTLPRETMIFRGRPEEKGIPYNSFTELTSAPPGTPRPNRLSRKGVSYFYGSFDPYTPVKEIHHYSEPPLPVISLGEFQTTAPVEVIDFTRIPMADFWMDGDDWQCYLFLRKFHDEITVAVSDSGDHVEYVPTQLFVEVLRRNFPKVDGIIYRSSLTGKPNICLFYDNSASARILRLNGINSVSP